MPRRGPAGRCLVIVLMALTPCLAAAAAPRQRNQAPPLQAAPLRPRPGHDVPRLRTWVDAVYRHLPGQADEAATIVASWTIPQLETLFYDLTALLQVETRPDAKPKLAGGARALTPAELAGLRELATREAPPGSIDPNDPRAAEAAARAVSRLVKRAALLHTDIAMLLDATADKTAGSTPPSVLLQPRLTVRVLDARQVGVEYYGSHWDIARLLLDQVQPSPVVDLAVRDWYRAVAAIFTRQSLLAESHVHLERAEKIFPADAEIALANGLLHEAEAAPRIQHFVESTAPTDHWRKSIGSARGNLRQAQNYHRKAAELDGASASAHVHLGRVTGLLGRHDEAARELRRAVETAREPRTVYYAWLFLGVEEDALGRADAAREAFEHAATVYSRAQSPYLALSQLARRRGDRSEARRRLEQVWALSKEDREREDPWGTYLLGTTAEPDALLADVRAALFLASGKR